MNILQGTAASSGLARGRAVVFVRPEYKVETAEVDDPEAEISRLTTAVATAVEELVRVKERMRNEMGEESAHIFRSQQTFLEDETILGEIQETVRNRRVSAEAAVQEVFGTYLSMFEELGEDDYNRARMTDLDDVQKRLLRNLMGNEETDLSALEKDSIVVATELFPSDTAGMNADNVVGMITEKGGLTSHVAILARNRGIPAAVGVENACSEVTEGETLWLDATDPEMGTVYVSPDPDTVRKLEERREREQARQAALAQEKELAAVTSDGHEVTVSANVGSEEEIPWARDAGADSVGLFRSEFLFMNQSSLPGEERQYEVYRRAAETFSDGFVILRTIDIGGDKPIASISLPEESNPFLGYRGVRISLDNPSLLRDQVRAALRASTKGRMKLMFPMISGPNEMKRLLAAVGDIKSELTRDGIDYDADAEVGIMVEVPSAVFMARELATLVDFVSIGTNDLTQYLLAADRMNEKVGDYYQPFHPAVFRAIEVVVEALHAEGKWVGVCGELAGMPLAVPALVGLGVDELSMSPKALAEAKHIIRRTDMGSIRDTVEKVMAASEEDEVKDILKDLRITEE